MKKSHSANDSEEFFREEEDEGKDWHFCLIPETLTASVGKVFLN